MSTINLFTLEKNVKSTEVSSYSAEYEKDLQKIVEGNMEIFFNIKFLASEYSIKEGRIDSLGIDDNNCPVIFEYKRDMDENIINQGLFYLGWLMDHKSEFENLAKSVGVEEVDWSNPCVICIARDFTKYDDYAVNEMRKNIKLVKYKIYDANLILFEQINIPNIRVASKNSDIVPSLEDKFKNILLFSNNDIKNLFYTIENYILKKDATIDINFFNTHIAYRKFKTLICVYFGKNGEPLHQIRLFLKLKEEVLNNKNLPIPVLEKKRFWNKISGDLEINISSLSEFEDNKKYIDLVIENN